MFLLITVRSNPCLILTKHHFIQISVNFVNVDGSEKYSSTKKMFRDELKLTSDDKN